jgi:hypothetical protein
MLEGSSVRLRALVCGAAVVLAAGAPGRAQEVAPGFPQNSPLGSPQSSPLGVKRWAAARSREFLRGRRVAGGGSAAKVLAAARRQHLAMVLAKAAAASPRAANLSAAWTAVGPAAVANPVYGSVSGRVTVVAIDPADATGNTVYVGTTGGGVWKSTNAAGPAAAVKFVPLTDTLPVFDLGTGSAVIPSLSIGAMAIGGGVLLAGTGDPNDATDSYYGGGILRSADSGLTWTLASAAGNGGGPNLTFEGMSTAGLAFSTANAQVAVAAISTSAEGAAVNAASPLYAQPGIYVSNDAGKTWQYATVMDGTRPVQESGGSSLGASPATAVVWNAARQMFFAAIANHGYFGSPDGAIWTKLANQPGAGITEAACPAITNSVGCPVARGALAVQASTGDTFALTVDAEDGDQGLYQDVCGLVNGSCGNAVAFGNKLNSAPLEVGSGSTEIAQADYDLALAAEASGTDTLLYIGTVDLYRCSLAAGCVLRDTTNAQNGCATPSGVAGAQHAIAGAGTLIVVGNDGGLWRSTDGVDETGGVCAATDAGHFQNLNAGIGSLGEVVSFAQDPVKTGTLLVGLGALGSAGTGTTAGVWAQMATGEGGTVAIDQTNPETWYVSTGAGVNIGNCAKGSACGLADFAATVIGAAQVDADDAELHAAWMLDPQNSGEMLVGTCRVWRGPAAGDAAWMGTDLLSAPLLDPGATGCGSTLRVVRSLAAGGVVDTSDVAPNLGSEMVYAGMEGPFGSSSGSGDLFETPAGNAAGSSTVWTNLALSPVTNGASQGAVFDAAGFDVSSVAADPHDASGETVYATVMGFAGNGLNTGQVYQSTTGGASWANITANLPNAPANSVVVDPNDANTVYVATDTGVYVTTSVTSCAGADCWSVYGTGLPNSPAMQLAASGGMATGDGRFGELRVGTYGRGIWEIPLVSSLAPAVPAMTLSPTTEAFGSQQVGTESAPATVTVTNSGNATLTVTNVTVSAGFVETDTCVGTPVLAGGTCTVSVSFAPLGTGPQTGALTVYGNVAGGQATAMLSGTGTTPASVVLTPGSLSFASTLVGQTTAAQNVTVSNTGGNAATVQSIAASVDFAVTANTCGSSLASDVGCTVSVTFTPTATGARSGTLTVVDSVGTQIATLSGTGEAAATDTLSPQLLTFAGQQVTTASAAQQVTLTNTGDQALPGIATQVSGDFAAVNGCGASLAGHSTCAISVTYVPKSVGAETGVLTVVDALRTQTISLSGTGIAGPGVLLTPAAGLTFAATAVGQTTAAQTVTLTNNGGVSLAVSGVSATGNFAVSASTCGTSVAVGASCTVQVSFAPMVGGVLTGSVVFTDNAAGSPQSLPLSGVGVDFSVTPDGATSMTVASGQTATYLLLLSAAAGVPGSAAFTCAGEPKTTTCTVSPVTATLATAGGTVVSVTISTGVSTGAVEAPSMPWNGKLVWLAVVVPVWLGLRKRRRFARLLVGLLLVGAGGCTTIGRTIPPSRTGGGTVTTTPSGSYGIVVSGTSAGLVQTVDLTLVVQ